MRNEEEFLPWREKNLKAAMRNRDGGEVVIHARGQAVEPDQAAASLRGDGPNQIHLGCVRVAPPLWARARAAGRTEAGERILIQIY